VRFCVLASGSSGNAIYIESETTKLVVDCGLSGKEMTRRFDVQGISPSQLDGILVTHEHHDHILGVGVLARKYDLPVYLHPDTLAASRGRMGWLPTIIPFEIGRTFGVGALQVTPFPLPHDAANPVGFTFATGGKKVGLATDMGYVPPWAKEHLRGIQGLILESNHDLQMLQEGPYAWPLKQRVMSRRGHLSNADAGLFLEDLMHEDLEHVVLAHISKVNNDPQIVHRTAERVVRQTGWTTNLSTALQGEIGPWIEIEHGSPAGSVALQPRLL
jgi:phosphoribosyl 1,2-cyclic phosphodiesterase